MLCIFDLSKKKYKHRTALKKKLLIYKEKKMKLIVFLGIHITPPVESLTHFNLIILFVVVYASQIFAKQINK
jgi:hypothetical protein